MANEIKQVTETKQDGDKAFKGDGLEGKKAPEVPPEPEKPRDKAAVLKEKKALLARLRQEDQKLEEKEDAKGIIDGRVSMARHARREAIRGLEHGIALIEKGK